MIFFHFSESDLLTLFAICLSISHSMSSVTAPAVAAGPPRPPAPGFVDDVVMDDTADRGHQDSRTEVARTSQHLAERLACLRTSSGSRAT